MGEINVSLEKLDGCISGLKEMQSGWMSKESELRGGRPDVSGGGQSRIAVEYVMDEYVNINQALLKLLNNTILFFEKVRNSMAFADENAANVMK